MKKLLICLALMIALTMGFAFAEETAVPFGESYTFETQITPDGRARLTADDGEYETLSFTVTMKGSRGPMHFKKFYGGDIELKGTEAVGEFAVTLNDYAGDAEIDLKNIVLFTLRAENGDMQKGYKLMNWEMLGSYDLPMVSGQPISVFKRYDFDEDDENPMQYLAVHSFNDGVETVQLMEMHDPRAKEDTFRIIYPELRRKSRGAAVKELQAKLRELGLLSGSSVDGVYGPGTAESVKSAQKLLGFEETGVATHEFQRALYKYEAED